MLTDNLTFSLVELIGMAVLAVGMLIQLVYLISLTSLIFRKKPGASSTEKPSVSIIITARNYAEELRESLPLLLEQNYPDYEVVVVDDCSTDHTDSVLRVTKHKYPRLKTTIVKQETDFANALALTVGIRAATNDWLIFLDPQVVVPGSGWLDAYSAYLEPGKDIVFGYVNYSRTSGYGRWWTRIENFTLALRYGPAWFFGLPMPISNINLAYRRKYFLEKRGFAAQLDTPFGENEMFVNKLSRKKNSAVAFDSATSVGISGPLMYYDWMNLKKKHLLLRRKFSVSQRFYLSLDTVSRILTDVALLVLLVISPYRFWILGVWAFRFFVEFLLMIAASKHLGDKGLVLRSFLYRNCLPLINGWMSWRQHIAAERKKWK